MANELANATVLMKDGDFRLWCLAASAYQARVVLTEDPSTPDHDVRMRLAKDVINNPEVIVDKVVNIIATDPQVAGQGSTVAAIGQPLMLNKIAEIWTPLAEVSFWS